MISIQAAVLASSKSYDSVSAEGMGSTQEYWRFVLSPSIPETWVTLLVVRGEHVAVCTMEKANVALNRRAFLMNLKVNREHYKINSLGEEKLMCVSAAVPLSMTIEKDKQYSVHNIWSRIRRESILAVAP